MGEAESSRTDLTAVDKHFVALAKAGVQKLRRSLIKRLLDSRLRGNDDHRSAFNFINTLLTSVRAVERPHTEVRAGWHLRDGGNAVRCKTSERWPSGLRRRS